MFFQVSFIKLVILVFVILCIVGGGYTIAQWLYSSNLYYSISYVIITGNRQFTTNNDMHHVITQSGFSGTFIKKDLDIIQKRIEQIPWIKQVSLRLQWPDILKIHIVEYDPLVYWNDDLVISTTGVVFKVPQNRIERKLKGFNEIPVLYGPKGTEQKVLKNYLIFNAILQSNELQLKSIKMDIRCSWQLILKNGVQLKLGRNNIIERLCFFIKIYPILLNKINEQNEHIDYVDLRYNSGCAVRWFNNAIKSVFCNK